MIPIDCKSLYHKQKIQYFCSVILSPCRLPIGEPALCYGDEENARIYAVHLTTANQSEIRRAYLVSVCSEGTKSSIATYLRSKCAAK